ncbi:MULTISPECIES: hypothetical protein [Streptomyces]|uniref:Phasin domain-containing protein n=1 Tax=Streptomyces eurythermus TaxID=42237 RepID=A0ABW6Z7V8_9ACTN|nr:MULTISPECIES: hypothetical protein [Streptomyces]QIS75046.1 hypothetical protein HB370_37970 [Streptomyces sp. DSM 40868]
MSAQHRPSSADDRLHEVFGAPVGDLHTAAVLPNASPALARALELRSFLAVAEEQVARVRDRVHAAMAPDRDMDELSAEALRWDQQWLQAALEARAGYRTALDQLLRAMPAPGQHTRTTRTAQPALSSAPSTAAVAPARTSAGATRARRL